MARNHYGKEQILSIVILITPPLKWLSALKWSGENFAVQNTLAPIALCVMPNLHKWAQIGENVKEIIIASCCPECGATVDHRRSALPIRLVAHQTQHSRSASSPQLHIVGRCAAFLSEYHSCTCFLSKMGDERSNYCGIISGCCTHSSNPHARHSKAQAGVKLWVTELHKMVNPGWLQYLNWTVLPFMRPRPLSNADKYHLWAAADGIAIHPGNE